MSSMILQNLRSTVPGVVPEGLAPGQLCFNLADDIMFVGDGSNSQTSFDGSQVATAAGTGWFSIPLHLNGLSEYFLQNPSFYGDNPSDGEVLTFSTVRGKPVWSPPAQASVSYVTTNAAVQAAPGVSTSEKISNAIGIAPVEGDSVVVSGSPGDLYQGYYLFLSGTWTFAAGYANPTALQVPYNNAISGLLATSVQAALDELSSSKLQKASNAPISGNLLSWSGSNPVWISPSSVFPTASEVSFDNTGTLIPYNNVQQALVYTWGNANDALQEANSAQEDATAAQVTANLALTAAQSAESKADDAVQAADDALTTAQLAESKADDAVQTADEAFTLASAALPKSGGTMTGNIAFNNGQLVDAGTY